MSLVALVAEAALLALGIALVLLVDAAFRSPLRAAWLKRDWIVSGAAFGCVALLSFTVALLVSGGIAAGLGLAAAMAVTGAVVLVSAFAFRRLLAGLTRRAAAGESPLFPSTGIPGSHPFGGAAVAEAPASDAIARL